MPRKPPGLALPQGLVDEAERSGGCAGEMVSLAPLPAFGGAALANTSAASATPAKPGSSTETGSPESPTTQRKNREQLDAFNTRALDDRVHELATALLREYLHRHAAEAGPLRDAVEAAMPRTEASVTKRSVIAGALGLPEPQKGQKDSLLETLVRRTIGPQATSIESGVYDASGEGDVAALGAQPSLHFNMSPDGTAVVVNGLAVGANTTARLFRVRELAELDLENADVIGKGAGGRVMRAKHLPTGEKLAVKEIFIGADDVIKQIEAEISVLWGTTSRQKDHVPSPFVVSCQGIFYNDGMLYIVMELMDGSLKDALNVHGAFHEDQLRAMAYQILHGLQYMHNDKKQLHRDIKPHNILYNRDGWIKLSDFGIASDRVATNTRSLKTFCGTLVYMAPGRAEGNSYGFETDVWSFGITLFELALGKLPTGNNLFEVIQLFSDPPRLPKDGRFSDDFRDFIEICIDPSATPASGVTVRQLLTHPWIAGMTIDRSQRVVGEVFREILTRTQRAAAGHKPVGLGKHDDLFATLDEVLDE